MCGILGSINRTLLSSDLDLIRHRGPDDAAISRQRIGEHLVTLGHTRLSIVDLSAAGRQPMWTSDGMHAIVFNGEIYNHLELRKGTQTEGYCGHSDTETALKYMARRGIQSVEDFNGIFGLGFVDVDQQRLFLARDLFGVKPLYYYGDGNTFLFSSELRPLLRYVDTTLDRSSLAELLRLRYLPSPDTLFTNVLKVRPGHIIDVDLSRPKVSFQEYAWAGPPSREMATEDHARALDRYGMLLEKAVERQLMSDVEIGVLLSGGVDSALIAALAQKYAKYKMKAFTVGYSGGEASDETSEARESAEILGLDHHVVQIGRAEFFDLLPRVSAIVEEPLATDSVVPMYYLSALSAGHVKVVLSGQGADEIMGGYRRYQSEILRHLVPASMLPLMKAGASLTRLRNDSLVRGLDAMGESDDVRRFESIYAVFATARIRGLIGTETSRPNERIQYFYDILECSRRQGSAQRLMSLDLRMNLADDLLLYTDKITMHHSMECRVPFLDHDLVRYVESLPCGFRLGKLRGKVLHKRLAARLLPRRVVRRKKNGFKTPIGSWLKSAEYIQDVLLDSRSPFSTYFDLKEVRSVLQEHVAGLNRERHVFLLLSIRHWMDEFLGPGSLSWAAASDLRA